jgi:8-amino-7-oxononanoate synthase
MRAEAMREAVATVRRADAARRRLAANVQLFRSLVRSPLPGGAVGAGAILPLIVGDSTAALRLAAALLERGFFVQAIRPPTVPKGTARLRVTLSALHREDEIVGLARALNDLVSET